MHTTTVMIWCLVKCVFVDLCAYSQCLSQPIGFERYVHIYTRFVGHTLHFCITQRSDMPGPDVSATKRTTIVTLLEERRYTVREIALRCQVSSSTVQRLKSALVGATVSPQRKGRCGRKRCTSKQDDRQLLRNLHRQPTASALQLHQQWRESGVYASIRTTRSRLQEMGCRSVVPRKVPALTKAMKVKRLRFAMDHRTWTVAEWRKVSGLLIMINNTFFKCLIFLFKSFWSILCSIF